MPKKRIEPKIDNTVVTLNLQSPQIPLLEFTDNHSKDCLEKLDAICYINLEHRTDRNTHILNEIHKFCTDASKIHRIDAIKKPLGIYGCGLSHIKSLEFALSNPKWKTILILEDDFTFKSNNMNEICYYIKKILDIDNLDVGLFSHNELKYTDTTQSDIKKVLYSQTASSYLIKREYIPTLLNNFREAMSDMERNGRKHENCHDIYWSKLQPINNWYAIYPAIGYQYDNYSDIEHRHCSYGC